MRNGSLESLSPPVPPSLRPLACCFLARNGGLVSLSLLAFRLLERNGGHVSLVLALPRLSRRTHSSTPHHPIVISLQESSFTLRWRTLSAMSAHLPVRHLGHMSAGRSRPALVFRVSVSVPLQPVSLRSPAASVFRVSTWVPQDHLRPQSRRDSAMPCPGGGSPHQCGDPTRSMTTQCQKASQLSSFPRPRCASKK